MIIGCLAYIYLLFLSDFISVSPSTCSEPQFYRLEGVWLTETGMSLLRSISMSPLHKRRQRRSRLGTMCIDELKEGDADGDEGKGQFITKMNNFYPLLTNYFLSLLQVKAGTVFING